MDSTLLKMHLSFVVPLKIEEMRRWTEMPEISPKTQHHLALLLSEYAEYAIYGGIPTSQRGISFHDETNRKLGIPRELIAEKPINLIVGIVACLAFQPGGVDIFDLHFDATEPLFKKEAPIDTR